MSYVMCTFFALLTILSFIPAMMLLWTCLFSLKCVFHNFANAMAFPGMHRKLALAMAFAPPVATLFYVLTFLRCHREQDGPEDVLDQRFTAFD